MQHAIDEINRIGVRGGVRGLEASALIDGDIHHHRAGLHGLQHFAPHQLGRRRSWNQHRADHQIGIADGIAHREDVGCERDHLAAINVVQRAQAIEIAIDDGDVRAQTDGHLGRLMAHHAAAQDHDIGGRHAGNAAQQDAAAAVGPLQIHRAHLHGHASGHFAHGREQRQRAVALREWFRIPPS